MWREYYPYCHEVGVGVVGVEALAEDSEGEVEFCVASLVDVAEVVVERYCCAEVGVGGLGTGRSG